MEAEGGIAIITQLDIEGMIGHMHTCETDMDGMSPFCKVHSVMRSEQQEQGVVSREQ